MTERTGSDRPPASPNVDHPYVEALSGPDLALLADLVAERVVERLRGVTGEVAGSRVLTSRQVAERLGRSTAWVREHRGELGQVPGVGERPRLLFDAAAVEAWVTAREEVVKSRAAEPASLLAPARRRRHASGSGVDLLPIRGDRRAA